MNLANAQRAPELDLPIMPHSRIAGAGPDAVHPPRGPLRPVWILPLGGATFEWPARERLLSVAGGSWAPGARRNARPRPPCGAFARLAALARRHSLSKATPWPLAPLDVRLVAHRPLPPARVTQPRSISGDNRLGVPPANPASEVCGVSPARRTALKPRPPCPTRPTAEELGGRSAAAGRPEPARERAGSAAAPPKRLVHRSAVESGQARGERVK